MGEGEVADRRGVIDGALCVCVGFCTNHLSGLRTSSVLVDNVHHCSRTQCHREDDRGIRRSCTSARSLLPVLDMQAFQR